jgi:hypothetical protein
MKYRNYNTTEELDQADAAWKKGAFLGQLEDTFHTTELYQLEDYYIEVTRHKHFNVILKVSSFKDTIHLEPYLESIQIDSLFGA